MMTQNHVSGLAVVNKEGEITGTLALVRVENVIGYHQIFTKVIGV